MSAPMDVQFKGYQIAARQMDIMRRAYPEAARAAIYTVATEVTTAIRDNAPEDTGFLKQSAYVASTKTTAKFGFGAWYAVIVNGRKNVKFKTGRKEFMFSTLRELFPTLGARLAAVTAGYIKSGTTIANVQRLYPPVPIAGDGYRRRRKSNRAPQTARYIVSRAFGGFSLARQPRRRKKDARKP